MSVWSFGSVNASLMCFRLVGKPRQPAVDDFHGCGYQTLSRVVCAVEVTWKLTTTRICHVREIRASRACAPRHGEHDGVRDVELRSWDRRECGALRCRCEGDDEMLGGR